MPAPVPATPRRSRRAAGRSTRSSRAVATGIGWSGWCSSRGARRHGEPPPPRLVAATVAVALRGRPSPARALRLGNDGDGPASRARARPARGARRASRRRRDDHARRAGPRRAPVALSSGRRRQREPRGRPRKGYKTQTVTVDGSRPKVARQARANAALGPPAGGERPRERGREPTGDRRRRRPVQEPLGELPETARWPFSGRSSRSTCSERSRIPPHGNSSGSIGPLPGWSCAQGYVFSVQPVARPGADRMSNDLPAGDGMNCTMPCTRLPPLLSPRLDAEDARDGLALHGRRRWTSIAMGLESAVTWRTPRTTRSAAPSPVRSRADRSLDVVAVGELLEREERVSGAAPEARPEDDDVPADEHDALGPPVAGHLHLEVERAASRPAGTPGRACTGRAPPSTGRPPGRPPAWAARAGAGPGVRRRGRCGGGGARGRLRRAA